MRAWSSLLLAAAALFTTPAAASEVARGHALAKAWCVGCHAVDRADLRASANDALSFTEIARLATSTSPALHAFLATPHPNMPNFKLTGSEIDDLVAYILSLRRR